MRLIDADALIEDIKTKLWDWNTVDSITSSTVLKQTITDIDNAPTIDAVPVVRCKDCKCWTEWENGTGSCSRYALDWVGMDADDVCSMGERKDNDGQR